MQRTNAHFFTLRPVDRPWQEANKLFLCRIYPVGSGYPVPDPPDVAPNYPGTVGKNTSGTPLIFSTMMLCHRQRTDMLRQF